MALRIGVHPNNLHLTLASHRPDLFESLEPEFVFYDEGRDSARLLAEGRIDVCGTGSTPPILAQAAGLAVQYLAASAPRPANGGLVVASESQFALTNLRGARVALLDGSFQTYLLARELEKVGLRLRDVERIELAPSASLRALQAGEVDVWVAMAPLLDQSVASGRVRLLSRCGETIQNRSLFWTLREREVLPETFDGFVEALIMLGQSVAANPQQAARKLAEAGIGGADLSAWQAIVTGRDWSIMPAGPDIIAEQQSEADTLHRHESLAQKLEITLAQLAP